MKKQKQQPKARSYRLIRETPLSYTLHSRSIPQYPLLVYDEEKNVNRVLRYASNQKSPFEDEQDGNVITPAIVFEDGLLHVGINNPVLQEFLHYHPLNGIIFEEIDKEKDASFDIEKLNVEVDALIEAKSLNLEQLETVYRVLFAKDPSIVTTAEMKRDVLVYAKVQPSDFMTIIKDPELKHNAKVTLLFEKGILVSKNDNKEVWLNTSGNKKKMMSVPFNEGVVEAAARYLKSDEGIETLKSIEAYLNK